MEITVAVLRGNAGMPLRVLLPIGTPYSFRHKYLARPKRVPHDDAGLRELALKIAAVFAVDWAARVDFIIEETTGRPMFLERDVAPLIGIGSAFASSLEAGGISRAEQLRLLLEQRR